VLAVKNAAYVVLQEKTMLRKRPACYSVCQLFASYIRIGCVAYACPMTSSLVGTKSVLIQS
ncbi:MAG: hypothetical protein WCR06_12465, partial [bacterium]